jgi:Ni2+-binding GTPase involved in maturation of urease and hydrogenase
MNKTMKNWLIVSGNGRDSGKTSLVCKLINQIKEDYPVTAIKISSHVHDPGTDLHIIYNKNDSLIALERSPKQGKDTARMKEAGAEKVFYVQTSSDENLQDILERLIREIPPAHPVICESGGMIWQLKPGLFLVVNREGREIADNKMNSIDNSDMLIDFNGSSFSKKTSGIKYTGKKWAMTK